MEGCAWLAFDFDGVWANGESEHKSKALVTYISLEKLDVWNFRDDDRAQSIASWTSFLP